MTTATLANARILHQRAWAATCRGGGLILIALLARRSVEHVTRFRRVGYPCNEAAGLLVRNPLAGWIHRWTRTDHSF